MKGHYNDPCTVGGRELDVSQLLVPVEHINVHMLMLYTYPKHIFMLFIVEFAVNAMTA